MRPLVALLMLTLPLAGCLDSGDPASTPGADPTVMPPRSHKEFAAGPLEETWITMSDGKRMHNAVFRPATDDPVPVFINFSPYWGDTAELGGDAFSQYMIDEYVPRGYAIVLSAIRGTGHSEGCFHIGGDREVQDLHEMVDFFAKAEWSNGLVATGGKSYDSSPTNGLIAKFPHPALKGVFHVSGITDMYAYNSKGGVPYTQGPIFNTYYYAQGTDEYGVSLVGAGSPEGEDAESLARLVDDVACSELPLIQAHGVGSGITGMKTDYWIERDWARYIADSDWDGSIFFVHGLQDWNVKPDHILPWIDNLPPQIQVKGWLHQGGHVYPERTDWNATMLAWLDHELKGLDNGFWDAPTWDVRGDDGLWRSSDAWPVGMEQTWEVTGGTPAGNIAVNVAVSNVKSIAIDPADVGLGNETGWLRMTGSPRIEITATPLASDAILTATVSVGGRWVTEGVLRSIYRDSLDAPAAIVPGLSETFVLDAYPVDAIIAPGETIEVTLGAGPRQSLANPAQMRAVEYGEATTFTATFLPADARADQPTDMECFAC